MKKTIRISGLPPAVPPKSSASPPATPVSTASPSTTQHGADKPTSASQRALKSSPKNKPTFWNSNKLIKLYAGSKPNAEPFTLHKEFACYYSPILKAAFNSNFIEGQTQEYHLECKGISENIVRLLVHWIYYQNLDLPQVRDEFPETGKDATDAPFVSKTGILVKLWVLADKLLIPSLQNATIDAIEGLRQKHKCESPLRRHLVTQCAAHLGAKSLLEHGTDFPREFLIDIIVFMKGHKQDTAAMTPVNNMSMYHVKD